ncbi:hypothetical protein ACFRCG_12435 [Embleya sp. NPDC056575]|uniref:hypothetical protein n=1 Tax=Embleya sp. NPDC056575 TaxID=3345869 RepID=UPI0036A299A2
MPNYSRKGECRVCTADFRHDNGSYYASGETAPEHDGRNGKHCPGSGHGLNDGGPMPEK